jgi:hypothetical protein
MRQTILTAVAAATIGVTALSGTASAAEQVEVCRQLGQTRICVRALETGAVVGVTICQGIFCFERNVPQPV